MSARTNRVEGDVRTACGARLATGGNRLLACADDAALAFLARHARPQAFSLGTTIQPASAPLDTAYFIGRGVASIIKPGDGERRVEIYLAGPESFLGSALILGDGQWPYETVVQSEDLHAIAIDRAPLLDLLARSPSFQRLLLAAMHVQMVQIAENLVSAAAQQIVARLARWLLMYRDRVDSLRLAVTHEFMSVMIGAQRPRVTAALHELEDAGAIIARRGVVTIRDAALLERWADGAYGRAEAEAARLGFTAPRG